MKKSDSGNSFSIILLIVPSINILFLIIKKTYFPITNFQFIVESSFVITCTYIVFAYLSFRRTELNLTLLAINLFLYFFWLFSSFGTLSYLNMSLDKSISTHFKEKILKTNFTTTHGRNVRASCEITVEKPIIHSRTQYDRGDVLNYESMKCDEVKVGDYLEGEIRQGFFKWPYIVNKSL